MLPLPDSSDYSRFTARGQHLAAIGARPRPFWPEASEYLNAMFEDQSPSRFPIPRGAKLRACLGRSTRGPRYGKNDPCMHRSVGSFDGRCLCRQSSPTFVRRSCPRATAIAIAIARNPGPRASLSRRAEVERHVRYPIKRDQAIVAYPLLDRRQSVYEVIPALFICHNREGFWVVRDAKGQFRGMFLLEESAGFELKEYVVLEAGECRRCA